MKNIFETICHLFIQNHHCMVSISAFKNCLRKDEKLWTLSGVILDKFHPLNFEFKYAGTCACFSLVFVWKHKNLPDLINCSLFWLWHVYILITALPDFMCWGEDVNSTHRYSRHWLALRTLTTFFLV